MAPSKKRQAKREAFLRQSERAVKISFLDGITRFKRRLSLDKLGEMYQARDYRGMDEHIGWDDIAVHLGDAKAAVGDAFDKSVDHAVAAVSVDEVNPKHLINVAARATQQKLKTRQRDYLQDLKESRKGIHSMVAEGLKLGRTPRDVARSIKEQVVLTEVQRGAIEKLRQKWVKQGLTPSQVQRRMEAKERSSLNYRANMIAITETRVAATAAELTVWQQQVKDGLLPKGIKKVWLAEPDACEAICRPMHNVSVGINDDWTLPSGDKSSPGAAHPRCRCAQALEDD